VDGSGLPADDSLAFAFDDGGHVTGLYLSSRSSQLFERLPWAQTPVFGQAVLAVCVLLFLSILVASLAAWLWGRGKPTGVKSQRAVVARRLAGGAAVLNLLFVLGYVALMLLAPDSIALGQVALLGGVLSLPVLAAVLALASLPFLWLAWKDGYWGLPARLHYTATVAGLLVFAWFLNQWNLLGWRF
jgi:hypothetical protein